MLPFKDDVTAALDFVVTVMSGIVVFSFKLILNVVVDTGAVVVVIIVGAVVEDRNGAGIVGPTLFGVDVVGESKE